MTKSDPENDPVWYFSEIVSKVLLESTATAQMVERLVAVVERIYTDVQALKDGQPVGLTRQQFEENFPYTVSQERQENMAPVRPVNTFTFNEGAPTPTYPQEGSINLVGTAPQPTPIGAVEDAVMTLDRTIGVLTEQVNKLISRLVPILHSRDGSPDNPAAELVGSIYAGSESPHIVTQLSGMQDNLRAVLARVMETQRNLGL